jgi:benzylsuccinate CoA-transferase BbsE subunit
MSEDSTHPLDGIVVVDATDASGAYCGRLLADLGADVVRIEAPSGDPMRHYEPIVRTASGEIVSCFERFVNLNKRSVTVDVTDDEGRDLAKRLIGRCDVLLDTPGPGDVTSHGFASTELAVLNPDLVRVSISSFGFEGPYSQNASDDLVTIASSGLLSLGGYEDTPPISVYGNQTYFAESIFGAVGAILGLLARAQDATARRIDVCGQEVMANALEDALPDYDLTGSIRRRFGDRAREAGSGTFACADGFVTMVAGRLGTAAAWMSLVAWLNEVGTEGADKLLDQRWNDHSFRQQRESITYFADVFERFAATRLKHDLYHEAQARRIALAPVNTFSDVLADPQLADRDFFETVTDPVTGLGMIYPGRPYRIDGLGPLVVRPAPTPGEHTREVFERMLGVPTGELHYLEKEDAP